MNDYLSKLSELMDDTKELLVLKGKLIVPEKRVKEATGEPFYTFRLKTIKKANEDEYGQGYNVYHCIIPVDVSKNFTDADIQKLKNNEVIVTFSVNCRVREVGEQKNAFNNITLFVSDIMVLRQIDQVIEQKRIAL